MMHRLYFSRDTHPDMKVIDAVIMSMSIPVVFATSMYDGKTYVDGSTTEFHPVAPFYDKRPTDVAVVGVKCARTGKHRQSATIFRGARARESREQKHEHRPRIRTL